MAKNRKSSSAEAGNRPRSAISVPFDATGYTRIELRGCDLDSIEHGTLVTQRRERRGGGENGR